MKIMDTGFKITGEVTFRVKRADGSILETTLHNMVVNYGLVGITTMLTTGVGFSPMTDLAMGDSSVAAALGDTALGNELRRDTAVVAQLPFPEDNKIQYQIEHAQGAVVGTFSEAGLFDQATLGGKMFNRLVFADLVVGAGDTLTVTWLIEVRNA
ncbi:MAG: hypothetical protein DRJ03_02405 [Chloroflexi bacterium]|nr:MAG: hypothetical protein DRJ03_02405 [Chloroflexota bacterium]